MKMAALMEDDMLNYNDWESPFGNETFEPSNPEKTVEISKPEKKSVR